jgi:hypothetical protein
MRADLPTSPRVKDSGAFNNCAAIKRIPAAIKMRRDRNMNGSA